MTRRYSANGSSVDRVYGSSGLASERAQSRVCWANFLPSPREGQSREGKSSQVVPAVTRASSPPCVVANTQTTGVRERGYTLLVASRNTPYKTARVWTKSTLKSPWRDTRTYSVYLVRFEWTCEQTRPTSVRRSWSDPATQRSTAANGSRVCVAVGWRPSPIVRGAPPLPSHNTRLETARPCERAPKRWLARPLRGNAS